MRVGIIALLQESNTFLHEPTTFRKFEQDLLCTGQQVHDRLAHAHHEVGGFFEGLEAVGVEAVPLFAARALPFGVITAGAFDRLIEVMIQELERAGPLDGLLAAPHGATVSAEYPDADGYWLSLIRRKLGSDVPIINTIDPHANLSSAMVTACDATIAYRTNPHVDQRQRGLEAASLMVRTLRNRVTPAQAAAFPPIAINIQRQHTTEMPCKQMYEWADAMLERDEVLSNSIVLGFPYADTAEMGSSIVVVTDGDYELAAQLSHELAGYLWDHRWEFAGEFIDVNEALDRAVQFEGPVCVLDIGDNVGGGAPGDGTHLAHAIHQRQISDAFVCLFDPASVKRAEQVGVGGRLLFCVGGTSDNLQGQPLEAPFTVLGLYDGRFEEPLPRHGGFDRFDQGRTAVVRTDEGLTVMLTSRRMTPFSLRQLTTFDVDPRDFQIIVAKGVNAPIAAYESVCPHFIRVNTPGLTCADMQQLDFEYRRTPMFPFEPEMDWSPIAA